MDNASVGLRSERDLRAALSASEVLLRQTLDATRTGTWSWDVAENVVVWSDNLGPIHGLPEGAQPTSYEELLDLIHPDDRALLTDAVDRCVREGRPYELELRTATPEGDARWIWASGSAMDVEDGAPRRIVGLTRDITDRKRVESAAVYAGSLQEVTAGLAVAGTVDEIARVIVDEGIPALSASTGILGVVEEPDVLRFVRSAGYGDVFPKRLRLSDPWPITDAVRSRRLIELRDLPDRRAGYSVPERVWDASGKGTLVAVPLIAGDRAIGALGFTRADALTLTAEERGLVEALAALAAQALDRAFLAEADRRGRVRAEALERVASAVATAASVEDVAGAVASEALELYDAFGATVVLVPHDDAARATVLASRGEVAQHATAEPVVDLTLGTLTAASMSAGTPLFAESLDELEASWPASADVASRLGVEAAACIPLRVGEQVGALSIVLARPRRFRPEERAFLQLLARSCEQGLVRASLYEAERAARRRADILHDLSAALSGALSPSDVGRAFVDRALGHVGTGTGALMLVDPEDRTLVAKAIGGEPGLRERWLPEVPTDGNFVISTAYRLQTPVAARNRTDLEERFPATAANFGRLAGSAYARPLVVEGRAIGAFGLVFAGEHELSADDERLLATMVRLCADAFERAQLYESEHRIAYRLQRALLPDNVARHPDLAIAARYQAGSERMEVGGDWYDTFELDGGRVGLAVGDVVGRGIEAAASMGRLRSAMAALVVEGASPGEVISRLRRFASGPGRVDFATTCFAVLDPATGVLRYASAGHPPLLVVDPLGEPRWLEDGRSEPLVDGARNPDHGEAATQLQPGSLLVLYSDGLVERRGEVIDDGLARLAGTASRLHELPVEALSDGLVEQLRAESHGDDVVLVVLRTSPVGAQLFRHVFPARPEELRIARDAVRSWLAARNVDRQRALDVVLAVGEACTNAVEHAYLSQPGEVEVALDGQPPEVVVTVRDGGRWRLPSGSTDRGRGIAVMRAIADEVDVVTTDSGTTVTMRFRVAEAVTA